MSNFVSHFEIPGEDPETLVDFYSRLFDWKISKVPSDDYEYWMIESVPTDEQGMPTQPGGINGGLYRRQSTNQKPMTYVTVENVDLYLARAAELGAQVAMGKTPIPGMGWYAQLVDPDENVFGIFQAGDGAGS